MTERIYEKDGALLKPKEKIVRCKDCRYQGEPRKIDGLRACKHNHVVMIAKDENFCPYGEGEEE